jgi:CheY-like chemotaxis protein
MRLDYTVLCIDDNIGTLRGTKISLTQHNKSVGIETKYIDVSVVQAPRGETDLGVFRARIFSDIASNFQKHQIDLIIVDLHLGEIKGHEIIEHIRENQTMYRPIVFYSGGEGKQIGTLEQHATKQLQDGLKEHNLVGKSVFLSVRGPNLIRDLRGICTEMHLEEHKLNASRGLLMDRTSEIDAKVLKHLRKKETWLSSDPGTQTKIGDLVAREIKRQRKNALTNASDMRKLAKSGLDGFSNWICDSTEKDVVFGLGAFSRNTLMRELLKMSEQTKQAGKIHSTYFKPHEGRLHLTSIRDTYAHQTEEQIGGDHDDAKCKYIREEIRLHLENVSKVTSPK